MDLLSGLVVIAPACRAGDPGSNPCPGENFSLKLLINFCILQIWTGTIPSITQYFWKEHCKPENIIKWDEGATGNMIMFSFPIFG